LVGLDSGSSANAHASVRRSPRDRAKQARRAASLAVPAAHRPAATLSNVKGKRDAPSLPANVTCPHSTQTNRSEPAMCVSGLPGAQLWKCSCDVTFSQPKHSFVTMVATLSGTQRRGPNARFSGPIQYALIAREGHQRHCRPRISERCAVRSALSAVVGDAPARSVYGLSKALDRVRAHDPKLGDTKKFQKLVTIASVQ